MSFSVICSIIAAIAFAVCSIWYTVDVARRKVTVSVATFFMFTVVNYSQLASLVVKHVWHVVPFTAVGAVTAMLIFLFALRNKRVYFEFLDKLGLAGALIGFVLWLVTKNAAVNVYILSAVNVIAFTPLIIKAFRHPDLESVKPWQLNLVASFFLLLTINSASVVVWIVPVRQFVCSLLLNIGLYRGRHNPKPHRA